LMTGGGQRVTGVSWLVIGNGLLVAFRRRRIVVKANNDHIHPCTLAESPVPSKLHNGRRRSRRPRNQNDDTRKSAAGQTCARKTLEGNGLGGVCLRVRFALTDKAV
jgi:hypothetical protein